MAESSAQETALLAPILPPDVQYSRSGLVDMSPAVEEHPLASLSTHFGRLFDKLINVTFV